MPTIYFTDNPSKSFTFSGLIIQEQEVIKVYFAKRISKKEYETTIKDHKTTKGQTLAKIAKKYGVKSKDVKRTKKTKYLQIGEIVKVTTKKLKGKHISFKRINNGLLDAEVYIVVETKHLEQENVLINILQGKEDVLAKVNEKVKVQQNNKDVGGLIRTKVGSYTEKDMLNSKDYEDWAIAKVKLQPIGKEKQKEWKDNLECNSQNKAKLYLLVDVHSENSIPKFKSEYVKYNGFVGNSDDNKTPNHFLNEEGNWFEVTDIHWNNPLDNPQLRGRYAIWAPERSIHSNNIKGRAKGKHDGIDLYAPEGTTLYACVDGEIYDPYVSGSYGNTLTIKGKYNNKEYYFFYAHLKDKVTYKAKDKVKAGDIIGYSGKTGSSAKNLKENQVHLHFEVRTKGTRTGNRINPITTISELKRDVNTNPKKEDQL